MKRIVPIIALILLVAGCGNDTPETPAEPAQAAPGEAPAVAEDAMEGMKLDLWPSTDTPGENVKPLLSIRAAQVKGLGAETNELTFEGAEAVVPAKSAEDREIRFSATRGSYLEGQKAVLSGGVTALIDDMTISLEDITWDIVPGEGGAPGTGIASSDNPLRITSPTQDLEAQGLRLYIVTQTFELRDVNGFITFSGETP